MAQQSKKDYSDINGASEKCADCGAKPGKEHKSTCRGGLHDLKSKQADLQASEMMAARGQCPRCQSIDTEMIDGNEMGEHKGSNNLYCHDCQQVTWTFNPGTPSRGTASKKSADMIHSDSELSQKMEPAAPAPEAGPSNTELVENSHSENGASSVLDGNIHSPERANVNAVREALETQKEMEVGKPIKQKEEELATEKSTGGANAVEIDAQPGKQIIINIASEDEDDKITSGMSDINGPAPSFHVSYTLNGKAGSKQFKTQAAGDAFIKGACAKFGSKIALDYPVNPKPTYRTSPRPQKEESNKYWYPKYQEWMSLSEAAYRKQTEAKPEHAMAQHAGDKLAYGGDDYGPSCPKCNKAIMTKFYVCPNCGHKTSSQKQADGEAPEMEQAKDRKYEGWSNWATWHVALLIDNTESSYNTKRRLALNALKKGIGIDQLAQQFSRMFKKQQVETEQFHNENAGQARDERGTYERHQLEGTKPEPSGNEIKDRVDELFGDMFYGLGGQSSWEEPMGEVNWKEIAWSAAEEEEEEAKSQGKELRKTPKPNFNDQDQGLMKSMGIKSSWKSAGMPEKGTPEWEQLQIALDTLRMPPAMAGVMGGMTREQAEELLQKYGVKYKKSKELPEKDKKNAGEGMAKTEQDVAKEAGFNFFFPGQVLKEFYPEIQHEIVDYPNASNSPMGLKAPEMTGDGGHDGDSLEAMIDGALGNVSIVEAIQLPADVSDPMSMEAADYSSTSPAGGMGIGRDGKSQVLEGVPLRKENDIRGPMFTDEFYGQYEGVPASAFSAVGSKIAAGAEVDQFAMFLKKVMGEIAATMIAAFKVTSRPLLDKVPGVGEVQLANVEQAQTSAVSSTLMGTTNASSRVKYLMDKLTDSEIQDAINDAWAQAAVWNDSGKGGYVYEVFARAESIDTDSMIMKYKFVAGTRE